MNAVLPVAILPNAELVVERGAWVALKRDLKISMAGKGELAQALAFLVIVASLFPLAVGPETMLLKRIAAGVVWVAALLAVLLTLPRLFASDYADGTLEQLLLSPYPLPLIVAGKILGHWLTTGLPLTLVAPLLGVQYGLEGAELAILMLGLLLGTPVLSMIGAIGAALTLGLRGASILMALLVLPLYVPVLIFGAGAAGQVQAAMDPTANLSLLGACLLFGALAAPFAAAAALKISLD
ncbi:MAG TPA: heme exporter protein CcmB [Usitatibacteraceae bacterium]|nr:heme exporter protein CcmB [Usitatibacteraceae bacterium]